MEIRFATVRRSAVAHIVMLAAVGGGARVAAAQQPPPAPTVEELLAKVLHEVGGRQLAVTKLVYPPGVSAMPHRHPAYLAAYVISGQMESALDDQTPIVYGPGDVWYEAHMQLHRVFRNPSATEPATVIVFALRDADHPANVRSASGAATTRGFAAAEPLGPADDAALRRLPSAVSSTQTGVKP